jgi:hypothetical protein
VIIDTEVNVRKYDLGEVRNGALGQVRSAKGEVKVNLRGSCDLSGIVLVLFFKNKGFGNDEIFCRI